MNSRAFTLLEVLIALAIMTVTMTAILLIQSTSLVRSGRTKNLGIVAMLAKSRMSESELELEGLQFSEVPKEKSGKFDEPYQEFGWKREIKEVKFPNLGLGTGGKDSSSQEAEQLSKLITQFLSKAIREVTITVSWGEGPGPDKFALTTYWVNLNQEFQLSE